MAFKSEFEKPVVQVVNDTDVGTEMKIRTANIEDDPEGNEKSSLYGRYISAGLAEDDARFVSGFSKAQDRAIYGKVDYRIFLVEGFVSVLFGISTFFFLPDTPALSASWLNKDERRYLMLMKQATRGSNAARATNGGRESETKEKFYWKAIKAMLLDHHIYLQAVVFTSNSIPNNGLKYTMSQIVRNMGYETTIAQLMSAPPYIADAIANIVPGIFADKRGNRMRSTILFQVFLLISMAVLFRYAPEITDNVALCYAMVMIACMAVYPIIPACNT